MSVRGRIDDAECLWLAGRQEGAVFLVLTAVAATARKRYPRDTYQDSVAYKNFIRDELKKITNGPYKNVEFYFRGDHHRTMEDVIYTFIRCELVHEGSLPDDIKLTFPEIRDGIPSGISPDGSPRDRTLFNVLELNDVLGFPVGWIWNLIRVVAEAPENVDEFCEGIYPIPEGYSVRAGLCVKYPDEHPERSPGAPPSADRERPSRSGDARKEQ